MRGIPAVAPEELSLPAGLATLARVRASPGRLVNNTQTPGREVGLGPGPCISHQLPGSASASRTLLQMARLRSAGREAGKETRTRCAWCLCSSCPQRGGNNREGWGSGCFLGWVVTKEPSPRVGGQTAQHGVGVRKVWGGEWMMRRKLPVPWRTQTGCWWRLQGQREGNWGVENGEADGSLNTKCLATCWSFGAPSWELGNCFKDVNQGGEGTHFVSYKIIQSAVRACWDRIQENQSAFKVLSFTKPWRLITSETMNWRRTKTCEILGRRIHRLVSGLNMQDILTALLEQQAAWNRGHVCSFNSVYPVSINALCRVGPH